MSQPVRVHTTEPVPPAAGAVVTVQAPIPAGSALQLAAMNVVNDGVESVTTMALSAPALVLVYVIVYSSTSFGRAELAVPAVPPSVRLRTDLASLRPAPPAAPTVVASVRVYVRPPVKVAVTVIAS